MLCFRSKELTFTYVSYSRRTAYLPGQLLKVSDRPPTPSSSCFGEVCCLHGFYPLLVFVSEQSHTYRSRAALNNFVLQLSLPLPSLSSAKSSHSHSHTHPHALTRTHNTQDAFMSFYESTVS